MLQLFKAISQVGFKPCTWDIVYTHPPGLAGSKRKKCDISYERLQDAHAGLLWNLEFCIFYLLSVHRSAGLEWQTWYHT